MRILAFIMLFGLLACKNDKPNSCVETEDETLEFKVEHAQHFNLRTSSDLIELDLLNPEDGTIEKTIKIESSDDLKIISLTSTLNGMLSILGKTDQLVGVSDMEYVFDQSIIDRYKEGEILEFGDETTQSVEKIVASGANIVFYSGFGESFPNQDQLEKIGISVVPVYDWREEDPLGKAEWIKLIGAITQTDLNANEFFNEVKEDYNRLKKIADKAKNKPSVISGNMLGDIWYTPVGDSYVAQLIKDAGGDYVYAESKGTGSLALSIEEILKDNESTEFWINPGVDSYDKNQKINPHSDLLSAHKNMYCYSPNMNLFWERSAAEPNKVLSDLIGIFHPDLKEDNRFHYYEKIEN